MFTPQHPGNLNNSNLGNLTGERRPKRPGSGVARLRLALMASALCAAASATAQDITPATTISDDMLGLLSPKPHSTQNPLVRPSREYRGIPMGDWMFYPTLLVGATYDDNLIWLTSNKVSAVGTRLSPRFVAVRNTGVHKTSIYGNVDAKIYPSLARGNAINAQAGIEHVWEVGRDFSITFKAEYVRKALHVAGGMVSTSSGSYMLATPLQADQLVGSVRVQKAFGKAFVGATAETMKTNYDDLHTSAGKFPQHYRDSWVNTFTLRAGYWVAPSIYAFAEASGNVRQYPSSSFTSKGYRLLAGVGSDRISLFRGEVYAGVQHQVYDNHLIRTAASPVLGGKLFWYPTRDLTIRAMVDQSFSDSSIPTPSNPGGYPQRLQIAQLSINYQFARDLMASGRVSYEHATYLGLSRKDNAVRAGLALSYEMHRNVNIVVDYDYTDLKSSAPGASYTRNAITVSAKFKY